MEFFVFHFGLVFIKEICQLKAVSNSKLSSILMGLLLVASSINASANLIVTYAEQPGVESSTLANTQVETFNSLTANTKYTNLAWTDGTGATIGTFDSIYIKSADQYGGATGTGYSNGSNYAVESLSVGSPNNVQTSTLTLNTASAYFGFWWSAGDKYNDVSFYSGSTLVADFSTATLMSKLPSTYNGNPRGPTSLDPSEPFAFINFYGASGVTFDKIVFTDTQSTGFEADNYTVRTDAWGTQTGETGAAPGITLATISGSSVYVIPEPSSTLLLMLGFGMLVAVQAGFKPRAAVKI
jgi:hypothetical protein